MAGDVYKRQVFHFEPPRKRIALTILFFIDEEYDVLKSQFATSNIKEKIHMRGGKKKVPYVFTEKEIIIIHNKKLK